MHSVYWVPRSFKSCHLHVRITADCNLCSSTLQWCLNEWNEIKIETRQTKQSSSIALRSSYSIGLPDVGTFNSGQGLSRTLWLVCTVCFSHNHDQNLSLGVQHPITSSSQPCLDCCLQVLTTADSPQTLALIRVAQVITPVSFSPMENTDYKNQLV